MHLIPRTPRRSSWKDLLLAWEEAESEKKDKRKKIKNGLNRDVSASGGLK